MPATKIYVVGSDELVIDMFRARGYNVTDVSHEADLVCFTGGADVNPTLYGEINNGLSFCDRRRDEYEIYAFDVMKDIPKVGICRGGQLLNVLSGGKMVQHVDGHGLWGTHRIYTTSNEVVNVTSTHHQQIDPDFSKCELIAVAEQDNGVEVVYYPETKSLCFQPHPEYREEETEEYFFKLINNKFGM